MRRHRTRHAIHEYLHTRLPHTGTIDSLIAIGVKRIKLVLEKDAWFSPLHIYHAHRSDALEVRRVRIAAISAFLFASGGWPLWRRRRLDLHSTLRPDVTISYRNRRFESPICPQAVYRSSTRPFIARVQWPTKRRVDDFPVSCYS